MATDGSTSRSASPRSSSEGAFPRSPREEEEDDEKEALKWAAHEKLPSLGLQERQRLIDKLVKVTDVDNEKFMLKLRYRFDRVGIELPKVEVRYEHLNIEAEAFLASKALPTFTSFFTNIIEAFFNSIHILTTKKKHLTILKDVSGIIKPGRMTLLLGPPSSGKTTLLLALAGQLDSSLKVSGRVTYNGHDMNEFVPQRTAAYISQHDVHIGEMTVRETLAFSARCQGVGSRYDMLTELARREKEAGIKPDLFIDVFMKAAATEGQEANVLTDYYLKVLGLDVCADTLVGDEMVRGISGGQKKRLTTGEIMVGPALALFMDEISNGLDSSTTFHIVNSLRQNIHILNGTAVISLLQPAPETYDLFDDIILLSDGQIVYQGPCELVLDFFKSMGFKCPERKGVADFLQEVTSRKDQRQYWVHREMPYRFITVQEFSEAFQSFHVGQKLTDELRTPLDKSKSHPAALTTKGANMNKDSVSDGGIYIGAMFFAVIMTTFNGMSDISMTVAKLPIFYKQRGLRFYPAWAYALPAWILKIPISFLEVSIWVFLTYYAIGFDPNIGRLFKQLLLLLFINQMASALFRFIAAAGRNMIVAMSFGSFALVVFFAFGGFVLSQDDINNGWIWGYWCSPMMYAQNAIVANEFFGHSWRKFTTNSTESLGVQVLKSRGFFPHAFWYWIGLGAMIGFVLLFNIGFTLSPTFLNRGIGGTVQLSTYRSNSSHSANSGVVMATQPKKRGMVLPFEPYSLTFDEVTYSADMPKEMKLKGVHDDKLVLLNGVSGAFRPGVLTALMGVSGAGKTTLMDVLAGRKTGGYITGNITISGYPKKQETFTRISGYCEQNDIHSPLVTVYESLLYSAWLRLRTEVDSETRKMFIEEIMELVELKPLRQSLVGLPGESGLSTEQRKRLTIAVELVANPSIIFMDEPTSGLDARAAAIVMRTVKNTVETGRTVVCTIHQPSIDIFEAFDELFLMKRGGQEIYVGPLGSNSSDLISYLQLMPMHVTFIFMKAIPGVEKIKDGYNPATWMLEVTSTTKELALGIDFTNIYKHSDLYRRNKALIEELSKPAPDSQDIYFPTRYSRSFFMQFLACLWKRHWSYWRNPPYNAVRFLFTTAIALTFGTMFWDMGTKTKQNQDLFNAMGSMYTAVFFIGAQLCSSVQPVVAVERTVYYREKGAGMYSGMSYAFAQVMIEIPYVLVLSVVYGVIVYAMIGFEWTAAKFFWYLFFMFFSLLYFTFYGMMTVAMTPNHNIAAIVSILFFGLWNVFSGFVIPRPTPQQPDVQHKDDYRDHARNSRSKIWEFSM
ncbi:ABC transporter G family member 40 [Citrus sinensis]|nr:ABC transporter G family member 40 [Citrus sinensis]